MMSVNGLNKDPGGGSGRRSGQAKRMPGSDVEDAEEGEVEIGEFAGEEFGGEARAEKKAAAPLGGKSGGVIGVEVGEEVGLAAGAPFIHRYHPALHWRGFSCVLNF